MKASTHSETERKYELDPDTRLPALDGLPGLVAISGPDAEELDAVYFDTDDLRLARAGITLRRRTGGPDAGWHLKEPVGADTRDETRLPLGSDQEPPAELAELLTAYTRGAALVPVARLTTRRDRRRLMGSDGLLAEVTDDRVTARPRGRPENTWREVEIELAGDTDASFLDQAERRLDEAGIRRSETDSKLRRALAADLTRPADPSPATAGQVVLSYLREQADAIARNDLRVRKGTADAVHQLRVATRKMRSALRVFGRIVDRAGTSRLEGELRWLAGRLGPARDHEVRYQRFHTAAAELPPELLVGPVNARLTRFFAPAQTAAGREVLRTLRGKRYRRLLDTIENLLADPPLTKAARRPARAELPRHIRRAYRKVARRMRAVRRMPPGPDRDRQTHRMRKAAKRFRYAVTAVAPAIGKPANRTRKRAKALTKELGEFQDSVMARPVLRELGMQAHLAGENGFTYGLLYGREEAAARGSERRLRRVWRRAAKKKARAWFP